jgi:hypothetical protein
MLRRAVEPRATAAIGPLVDEVRRLRHVMKRAHSQVRVEDMPRDAARAWWREVMSIHAEEASGEAQAGPPAGPRVCQTSLDAAASRAAEAGLGADAEALIEAARQLAGVMHVAVPFAAPAVALDLAAVVCQAQPGEAGQ